MEYQDISIEALCEIFLCVINNATDLPCILSVITVINLMTTHFEYPIAP